uniref:Uncharacterized protein n=1 Tax=Anguilla anguilla TaxID=7936 RepID=A0A0E9SLA5_ANGAN
MFTVVEQMNRFIICKCKHKYNFLYNSSSSFLESSCVSCMCHETVQTEIRLNLYVHI